MYNIQKAVSRLDYAPKLKEIQITNIKKGLGLFTPKPDKPVSFEALKATLKKAGYTLDSADITVMGTVQKEGNTWLLVLDSTNQRFTLDNAQSKVDDDKVGDKFEVTGNWKTVGAGASSHEVISVRSVKKAETGVRGVMRLGDRPLLVNFVHAKFEPQFFTGSSPAEAPEAESLAPQPLAPIRTTSPGLTVYKGGAITPRLYLIKQHLGTLDVKRQVLDLSISYTPSPRVQLEAEIPFMRTTFDDGVSSGSGVGLGNVVVWSKYRFYRTVKTYGDRQAALRFGLELPTGKKTAPSVETINAAAFVRQQLTPINGGLSPHFDVAFSQAGGRVIFGGNVEGIVRAERDGFRMGHEVRVNTDLEYVLLPRDYQAPGKELFLILESTFLHRARGRLDGSVVDGSKSTEFYLSPGLQYASDPRFVVEGSVQIPVVRKSGPLVLRTDINILAGIKYLF